MVALDLCATGRLLDHGTLTDFLPLWPDLRRSAYCGDPKRDRALSNAC